jgi:hypothetical protein
MGRPAKYPQATVKNVVYKITNKVTKRVYVGLTTIEFGQRCAVHVSDLRHNTHHSPLMQEDFVRFGEESFRFEILEKVGQTLLHEREQYWIKELQSTDPQRGYNQYIVTGIQKGTKLRREVVDKIRAIKAERYGKAVLATLPDGAVLQFRSVHDAARHFGVSANNVSSACHRHHKCKGATFQYVHQLTQGVAA